MDLEDEVGDDTEVAAASAQCPEQIRVALIVHRARVSVRRHHAHCDKAVQRQPKFAARNAESASERDAGYANRWARPRWKGGAVVSQSRGDVDQLAARPDGRESVPSVEVDRVEPAQVDYDAVCQCGVALVAMAAGAGAHPDTVGDRESDGIAHVLDVGGPRHNDRQDVVEAPVEYVGDAVKPGLSGREYVPADRASQPLADAGCGRRTEQGGWLSGRTGGNR
jgi:hypothetical protein